MKFLMCCFLFICLSLNAFGCDCKRNLEKCDEVFTTIQNLLFEKDKSYNEFIRSANFNFDTNQFWYQLGQYEGVELCYMQLLKIFERD